MFHQNNIVLIGNSLVEQSKSIKYLKKRVINIDSFNDIDLVGENYINSDSFGYVNDNVIEILKKLDLKREDTLIIVSSEYGKNKNYHSLLESYGKIIGNSYKTISNLQNHRNLINTLDKNNITHPKKFFTKESIEEPVLIKNSYLSGGFGIKKYKNGLEINNEYEYFEQYVKGNSYSVLFVANEEKKIEIIGINKIFNKKTAYSAFSFSGACSNISFSDINIKYLKKIINIFVIEYDLVGFNGIDFIISDDIYFLEINPRLTQTCFLYDEYFSGGYLLAHINSILNGELPSCKKKRDDVIFFENLFAKESFIFNQDLEKFDFVTNIPKSNTFIDVGEPICTISSRSNNEKKAKNLLLNNISLIKKNFKNLEII